LAPRSEGAACQVQSQKPLDLNKCSFDLRITWRMCLVRRGTADPLLSLEALVGVSHSGLGVHVREQQQCNRGAQKWSRDAE
jgi:hypothetical protein